MFDYSILSDDYTRILSETFRDFLETFPKDLQALASWARGLPSAMEILSLSVIATRLPVRHEHRVIAGDKVRLTFLEEVTSLQASNNYCFFSTFSRVRSSCFVTVKKSTAWRPVVEESIRCTRRNTHV